jgi:hypothetical protein
MAALGVVAGLCLVGVWAGTSALVVPAGLAMYVVGLDSVEPLAEELDHPDIQNQIALPAGWLHLRQLLPSALLCVVAGIIAIAGAVAVGGGYLALEVGAVALIPAALGGAAGAALSVVNGPPPAASVSGMLPPELAGSLVMLRLIVPPLLAVLGCLPVLVARHAWHNHERVAAAELLLALPMLGLIALGLVWVRFSEDIKAWWQTQLELMKTTQRSPRGQ